MRNIESNIRWQCVWHWKNRQNLFAFYPHLNPVFIQFSLKCFCMLMVHRVLLCCYSTFTEGRVKRDRVHVAMVVCSGFGHVSSGVCSAVRQRLPVKVHSYLFGNINYSCQSVFFLDFSGWKRLTWMKRRVHLKRVLICSFECSLVRREARHSQT